MRVRRMVVSLITMFIVDSIISEVFALTLEAESMSIKTTGNQIAESWVLWTSGYIANDVNFQQDGSYSFDVVAKGDYAGGAWPRMELRIDKVTVGSVAVSSSSHATYNFTVGGIAAGIHQVALAFTNDYYDSSTGADRNLRIDKVTINSSSTPPPSSDSPPTDGGIKLIEWGWDTLSTAYVKNNIATMEKKPFDGIVVSALVNQHDKHYFSRRIFTTMSHTKTQVQADINNLIATTFSKLTERFIKLNIGAEFDPPDWFDDWTVPINNVKILAQVAKEGGLKGIFFDTETYGDYVPSREAFDYQTRKYASTKTLADYKAQARLRGQQIMKAINEVYPNIAMLLTYCYFPGSGVSEYGVFTRYELLDSFCSGMLEAADSGTIIHEMGEGAYGFKTDLEFINLRDKLRAKASDMSGQRSKIQSNFKIGFGLWIDNRSYQDNCSLKYAWSTTNFGCNWFSPQEFGNSIFNAIRRADSGSYVWIYTQKTNWWAGYNLPQAYIDAVKDARSAAGLPVW